MSDYYITPRGFYGSSVETTAAVDRIWVKYSKRISRVPSLDLINELVAVLSKEFGNFRDWLKANLEATHTPNPEAREFLIDTVDFTQTGKRRLCVHNWGDLIRYADASPRQVDFRGVLIPTTEDLIMGWIKTTDGIVDMFETAFMVFSSRD